jgi:hypothetical protein
MSSLRTPPFPWQGDTLDVALEIDPVSGLLAYRVVIITVPRQSGKTKLELGVATHRCVTWANQVVTYTAQTRLKAREKWEDDHLKTLEASPFASLFRPRKTSGMEAMLWSNGSKYGIEATTEKAGHGDTLDLGFIDEAFAQVDARTEQAMKPAMITRPQPQLWIVSTAGTDASVFLREKVEMGRALAEAGVTEGVCYVEYSALEDADPADPATWWGCMPALGIMRDDGAGVTEAAVRADFQSMNLGEFRRGYLNQWVAEIPDEWQVIPKDVWMSLQSDPVAHGQVAIAADVTPRMPGEKVWGSVAAAWERPDGCTDVEIIRHSEGTAWMSEFIAALVRRHRPYATVIDAVGPAASLVDQIEALGVEVTRPNSREVVQACGRFFDAAMDARTLRHGGDPALDAAVAGAMRRDLGDGWAWARKGTNVDISPLVACTLASWAYDRFATRQAPYDLLRSVS